MRKILLAIIYIFCAAGFVYADSFSGGGGTGGSGSGTVNSGTTGQVAVYPSNGTAVGGSSSPSLSKIVGTGTQPADSNTGVQFHNGTNTNLWIDGSSSNSEIVSLNDAGNTYEPLYFDGSTFVWYVNGSANVATLTSTNLVSYVPLVMTASSALITTDTTSGHTLSIDAYNGSTYVPLITLTNGATPAVTFPNGLSVTGGSITSTSPLSIGSVTLPAGTATAGTAPLYFQSGTNLTSAAAGAMEYDGTNFYLTPSSTRKTIAFNDLSNISAASAVTGQLLTGYSSGAGTVAATDTILQGIQKLNGNQAAGNINNTASGSSPVTVGSSGMYWNNQGSTTAIRYNLPAIAVGQQYCFGNIGATSGAITIAINTQSGVYIYYKGVAGAASTGTLVSSGAAGDFICLEAASTTAFMVTGAGYGTWTNN